jgi:hypothetical protein
VILPKIYKTFIFTLLALIAFISIDFHQGNNSQVKAQISENVTVTAAVYSCTLSINVKPEKRIPVINNWDTEIDVEIYNSGGTFLGDFNAPTDNMGNATVNICAEGILITGGTYDFYIKGFSHLRMHFDNYVGFGTQQTTIDFSSSGQRLFAGETSVIYDNFINTLDLSTQIVKMETADVKNDLNQDGEVNALDISNTITNYLLSGDCSPQEIIDGDCQ